MSFISLSRVLFNLQVNRREREKTHNDDDGKGNVQNSFNIELSIISLFQSKCIRSREEKKSLMIDFCIYTRINVFQSLLLRLRFQSTKKQQPDSSPSSVALSHSLSSLSIKNKKAQETILIDLPSRQVVACHQLCERREVFSRLNISFFSTRCFFINQKENIFSCQFVHRYEVIDTDRRHLRLSHFRNDLDLLSK